MARLPIVGSDDGTWGGILNSYLEVEHNNGNGTTGLEGTHKAITIPGMTNTTDDALKIKLSTDTATSYRFFINADGFLEWGPGGSSGTNNPDTNLYRAAANELKTDDSLSIASRLGVGADASAGVMARVHATSTSQVAITARGASGQTADLQQWQNSSATSLAAISSAGVFTANNYKRGTGAPNTSVSGSVGDLYLQTDGGTGSTLWIKESGSATNTGWVAVSTAGNATLQSAYDASSSPAQITTSATAKNIIFKSGTGFNTATAFQVIPDATTTPTLNVDTTNARIGINNAAPEAKLHVSGGDFKIGESADGSARQFIFGRNLTVASQQGGAIQTVNGGTLTDRIVFDRDYIELLNGNVGIGATNPSTRLVVGSNGSANEVITVQSQGSAGLELLADTDNDASEVGSPYISFAQDGTATTAVLGQVQSATADPAGGTVPASTYTVNSFVIGTKAGANPLHLATGNASGQPLPRLTILGNAAGTTEGHVGIGTTSPGASLTVTRGNATSPVQRWSRTDTSAAWDVGMAADDLRIWRSTGSGNIVLGVDNGGTGNAGNVVIGGTSSTGRLTVTGATTTDQLALGQSTQYLRLGTDSSGNSYITSNATHTGSSNWNYVNTSAYGSTAMRMHLSSIFALSTVTTGTDPIAWSERLRVTNDGKMRLGTGTVTPTNQLEFMPSTSNTGGISFGTDTPAANLYRSATSTLKTDGNFIVAGSLTVEGSTSIPAGSITTLATNQKQVYGNWGSSNHVGGDTTDKWAKVAEFTVNGAYSNFKIWAKGGSRTTGSAQTEGNMFELFVAARNGNTGTDLETPHVRLQQFTSFTRSIKDIRLVRRSGTGITSNLMELWIQFGASWQDTFPVEIRYWGAGTLNTLATTPQPQLTSVTTGFVAEFGVNSYPYMQGYTALGDAPFSPSYRIHLASDTTENGGIGFGGDAVIYRSTTAQIKTNSTFLSQRTNDTDVGLGVIKSGEALAKWVAQADGYLWWGDGTAARDTSLYRSAAGILRTDGLIHSGTPTSAVSAANTNAIIRSFSSGSTTTGLALESQIASAANSGTGAIFYSNDGAALASGDRMGYMLFGGSRSSASVSNAAGLVAYASAAWTSTSTPGIVAFETAPTGSINRTEKISIPADLDGIQFGSARDTNLYRESTGEALKTDDQFIAAGGISTKTTAGAPTDSDFQVDQDGNIAVDSTNHALYYRSGGTWRSLSSTSLGNAFVQGGNSFGSAATLGTNDNNDLIFETNGTEAARFTTDNRLGIGVTEPMAAIQTPNQTAAQFDGALVTPFVSIGEYSNFLLRSEEFSNATWVKTGIGTVTVDSATDPQGTAGAENIPAGSTGTDNLSQVVTNSTTGFWTFSVWLKAQSGTAQIQLRLDSSAAAGTAKTISLSTTWKRYAVTENFSAAHTTKTVYIISGTTAIAAWGAQLDNSNHARGYAVTTTSAQGLARLARFRQAAHVASTLQVDSTTTVFRTGLAATSSDALIVNNSTSATSGTPVQMSGRLRLTGNVWDTGAAATRSTSFKVEVLPTSANPGTARMLWGYDYNGGGYTELLSLNSDGKLQFGSAFDTTLYRSAAGDLKTDNTFIATQTVRSAEFASVTTGLTYVKTSHDTSSVGIVLQNAGHKGLTVRGVAAQTGNLTEWQNNTPTTVAYIDPGGKGVFSTAGIVTKHDGASTPTGGSTGQVHVGTDKIWANDAGTWKSVDLGAGAAGTSFVSQSKWGTD